MEDYKEDIDINSQKTPYILKAVSFILIFSSAIAIFFFLYILLFNENIISETASFVENPLLSISSYLVVEVILFSFLIAGSVQLIRKIKWGFVIIAVSLTLLLILNYFYYDHFDWVYLTIYILVLLILSFFVRKLK
ncbi:MAG: hypothetical protein C0598_10720 [Marinilabiliales bacterium]|nr:MAG: hypothetical protein C0598_10720 [Marinilabiliales bacterium]